MVTIVINKVLEYVNRYHMFDKNDYVVAGVSGGADSVCLFFMLLEIQRIIPIKLHIVHINHMIRTDAAQDAEYVGMLCEKYKVPFTLVEQDVEGLAKKQHISTEEAGRNVRYTAFYKVLKDNTGNMENGETINGKIAIAHNKNDSCETFLFNLFRGSSLKGLSGIAPVREHIVRPLMCLERDEIEEYLNAKGIKYCIDSTNLEDNYTRNKIRHHILNVARKDISPVAVSHINDATERIREAYDLLEDLTQRGFEECVTCYEKEYHINECLFNRLHTTIQGYVVMQVLSEAAGSRKDLEAVHIQQVKALMQKQCGRRITLPYGLTAEKDYEGIMVKKTQQPRNMTPASEIVLSCEDIEGLKDGKTAEFIWKHNARLIFSVISIKDNDKSSKIHDNSDGNPTENMEYMKNIPQKKYTKWIDYDKINDGVVIRTRRKGDYLTINSLNQRKTIKAYFIDNKISKDLRDEICLVADGSHVIWIVGERISNEYKVTESTKNILQITFTEE